MLYQTLIASSFFVLSLVCLHSYRTSEGGARYSVITLYGCALAFVLSGMYPQTYGPSPVWLASINILSFALLFPILFINLKHYTALSLPQWRALRAFSLGIPLVLGLSGVVVEVLQGEALSAALLPPYVWVAYCYGALCVLVVAWRFTSTPRQCKPLALLAAVPCMIVAADITFRLGGWLFLQRNPAVSVTLVCIILLSALLVRRDGFNVRPFARSALVDQVQDLMLVVDPNQRLADCNRAAALWLGQSESQLIGARLQSLFDLLTDAIPVSAVVPWRVNNEQFWFEVVAADLIIDDQPHGILLTLRDVSARRQTELELMASRRELQLVNAKLQEQANTDVLTGLANRRYLMERLSAEIERHSRSGMALGLLMIDLDHFKQINDGFGHPVGDLVLQRAAQCMRNTVRESDIVGRIGGEEFAVIAVDTKDEGPAVLADRLKQNLASVSVQAQPGVSLNFTVSIGCVHFTGNVIDVDTLIRLADEALYVAKREGRNRVHHRVYEDADVAGILG